MNLLGILMIPADPPVVADLERWGIRSVLPISLGAPIEQLVARRTKGQSAIVFASPRRRWSEVMEALRVAAVNVAGELTLRFYQPNVTIDLRTRSAAEGSRWWLCPTVAEFDKGQGSKAYAVKRAVKDGLADLLGDEMRALAAERNIFEQRVKIVEERRRLIEKHSAGAA